jgi:hypothetical protein
MWRVLRDATAGNAVVECLWLSVLRHWLTPGIAERARTASAIRKLQFCERSPRRGEEM